ncbi:MAG: ATP-binding cassette domain-containing protein [Myxococcales bacterium]|nr:ATP-binding cassette domain-containing protein [Myxococcales bacterium]
MAGVEELVDAGEDLRAVVGQHSEVSGPLSAFEVARLGRYAHRDEDRPESARLALEVLDSVDLSADSDRPYATLSGGARQRVQLARALLQLVPSGRWLLLDEPTTWLDPAQQHLVLARARAETERGRGVVAVLHDLGLAARYADRVVLLDEGRLVAMGAPAEVFTPARLEAVWGLSFTLVTVGDVRIPLAFNPNSKVSR